MLHSVLLVSIAPLEQVVLPIVVLLVTVVLRVRVSKGRHTAHAVQRRAAGAGRAAQRRAAGDRRAARKPK